MTARQELTTHQLQVLIWAHNEAQRQFNEAAREREEYLKAPCACGCGHAGPCPDQQVRDDEIPF